MGNSDYDKKIFRKFSESTMDINKSSKNSTDRPEFYPCQWCKGMFTARALELHAGSCYNSPNNQNKSTNVRKVQINRKQHKCEFCYKIFKRPVALKRHLASKVCQESGKMIHDNFISNSLDDEEKLELQKTSSVIISNNQNNSENESSIYKSNDTNLNNKIKTFQHFPCKICHLVFAHEKNLQEHLKSHKLHDKDVELYAQNYDLIENNIDIEEPNSFEKIDYSNKNSNHIENSNISIQECNNNSYIKSNNNNNNGRTSVIVRSESIFLCHKCGQMFLTEEEYNHHCIMHETKAHCSVCGDDVPQEAYGEHIIQHAVVDDGQWLRCAHCEKTFLNETLLLVHYRIHIQDTQFFCTECNQEFNQAIDLKYHTLSVHGHLQLQPYHCYICLRRFSQPHAIINHMRLHTGEMPFKCQECGRAFTQLGNLQRHLNMHRGERPHKCQICDKGFADPATLRNHIRTHTGETPYVCNVCKRAFSQIGNLKRHMSKHLALKPHGCPDCGKGFAHESTLRNHRRIHTGEQPFKCTICSRAFSQIGNLKRHMAKHALQQDFQCGQCSKNFNTSQELIQHECVCSENSHMLVSEEENVTELPIPCHMITQWPKCTSQSQKLLKKLAMEENNEINSEKNYEHSYSLNKNCDSSSNNYVADAKISNSNETSSNSSSKDGAISRKWRIFPCPVCGKVYTWQYDLRIHYRIHSGEKPYKCELCGKGFAQSGAVKTHKARHHQDETEQLPMSSDSNSSEEHVIEVEPSSVLM